jgi:hypothetical protein
MRQRLLDQRDKGCQGRLQLLHRQTRRISQRLSLQGRQAFTQATQISLHLGGQLGVPAFTAVDKQVGTGTKHLHLRQLHLGQRHIRRGLCYRAEKNQYQAQQVTHVGAVHRTAIHKEKSPEYREAAG